MRDSPPPLLPLIRSIGLARLVAYLHSRSDDGRAESISDLARRLSFDLDATRRYVDQLEQAGVVQTWLAGRSRIVELDASCPLQPELGALILKAFGPPESLGQLLSTADGVHEAYIFGSWAERYEGRKGPPPSDIDVLVIGSPNAPALRRVLGEAARSFGREVNLTILTGDEWASSTSAFVTTVKGGTLLRLVG